MFLYLITSSCDFAAQLNDNYSTDLPLQFEWPEVEKGSGMRETKMLYKFDYLPAGLFNRGQVGAMPFSPDADRTDALMLLEDCNCVICSKKQLNYLLFSCLWMSCPCIILLICDE